MTIKTALLSILALLSAAEPNDPQDAEVARMYLNDYDRFVSTARFWTESFAKECTSSAMQESIDRLVDMGFPSVSDPLYCELIHFMKAMLILGSSNESTRFL